VKGENTMSQQPQNSPEDGLALLKSLKPDDFKVAIMPLSKAQLDAVAHVFNQEAIMHNNTLGNLLDGADPATVSQVMDEAVLDITTKIEELNLKCALIKCRP
jgi:hypothetical protein